MTFHKYPKIHALGYEENKEIFTEPEDEIVIEEKIDGANFRFMIKDGILIFGSHTQQLTSNEGEDANLGKNFRRCAEFIRKQLADKDLALLDKRIYYGECCVRHTLAYDWEKIPPFLGFDIFCLEHEKMLRNKTMLFEAMGLPVVPLIKVVKAGEIKEMKDEDVPISVYPSPSSKDRQAEGVVFKNYQKQIMAKFVREKFKEVNKEAFGGGKRFAKDDTERIVAVYCTNARIDKHIFKLIDAGEKLEMALMHKLPNVVFKDIFEENWEEIIIKGKPVIDFKELKGQISKRCLGVLKQVITNNALQVKE